MQWWKSKLCLVLAGTLSGVLLCEVGLRAAGVSYPIFTQIDGDVGFSLRPGAEGWWKKEGKTYVRINSAGLRDREHSLVKPAHTLRIAVLGDSYAEALQVPMEDAFWSVLERELKGCPAFTGREPEVINFGVSGYGTAQELITLRHRGWPYSPDIILMAFLYVEPQDPVWKEAWQVTQGLVVLMRDEVRQKGADFLLVTLSNGPQVHPDPVVRRAFAKRLGVPHLLYPDVRLRDLGQREGFAVLNLAPIFQTYAEEHQVFRHGFTNSVLGLGHWNNEGHRLAGQLIAGKLCSDFTPTSR